MVVESGHSTQENLGAGNKEIKERFAEIAKPLVTEGRERKWNDG